MGEFGCEKREEEKEEETAEEVMEEEKFCIPC